jgi:hypothetical protein
MKKNFFLLFIFGFTHFAFAQLQNPSFELWDSGDPIYWQTSDFYDPGTAIQSSDAHGGDFALNMNVVLDSNGTAVGPYAFNVFPLTTMPQVLTFWIKGNLPPNNNVNASFTLIENDSASNILAYGDQTFTTVSNVYTYKFLNILPLLGPSLLGQGNVYFDINAPFGSNLNDNASVFIDDIYLGVDNTGLFKTEMQNEIIEKLYPNPAQDMAYLVFNMKGFGKVSLKVYDLLGNNVQDVIDEDMAEGRYKAVINTTELVKGLYYCKLTVNGLEYASKLIKQ